MCDIKDAFAGDLVTGPASKTCHCELCKGNWRVSRRVIGHYQHLDGAFHATEPWARHRDGARLVHYRFRVQTTASGLVSKLERSAGGTIHSRGETWNELFGHQATDASAECFQQACDFLFQAVMKVRLQIAKNAERKAI